MFYVRCTLYIVYSCQTACAECVREQQRFVGVSAGKKLTQQNTNAELQEYDGY